MCFNPYAKSLSSSFDPKEEKYYCEVTTDHSNTTWMTISTTTMHRRFHNQGLYAKWPVVCVSNSTHVPLYVRRESTLPEPNCIVLLYSSQTSAGLLWREIKVMCFGKNKAPDTMNATLSKDTIIEEVASWFWLESLCMCVMEEFWLLWDNDMSYTQMWSYGSLRITWIYGTRSLPRMPHHRLVLLWINSIQWMKINDLTETGLLMNILRMRSGANGKASAISGP